MSAFKVQLTADQKAVAGSNGVVSAPAKQQRAASHPVLSQRCSANENRPSKAAVLGGDGRLCENLN